MCAPLRRGSRRASSSTAHWSTTGCASSRRAGGGQSRREGDGPRFITPSASPSRRTLSTPQEELKSLDPETFKRCHFFNSSFYTRLLQTMQGGSSAKEREAAYQHVRGWTTRAPPLLPTRLPRLPASLSLHVYGRAASGRGAHREKERAPAARLGTSTSSLRTTSSCRSTRACTGPSPSCAGTRPLGGDHPRSSLTRGHHSCRPGLWAQQQHAALPSQQPAAAEEEDSEEDESCELADPPPPPIRPA